MLIVHGAGGGYDQGEYFAKIIGGNYRWIAPSRFGFLAMNSRHWVRRYPMARIHRFRLMLMPACWMLWESTGWES